MDEIPRSLNREVQSISLRKRILGFPLVVLLKVWLRTLRVRFSPEMRAFFAENEDPVIFAIWHNRLMIASEIHRRLIPYASVAGLVSASKDGAWLSYLFRKLGIRAVRGSTSYRGKQAFRELLRLREQGVWLAVTPDGPRGPCYHFQRGVSELARISGSPLVLIGVEFHAYWKLSSWDQFRLPKPWSRVIVGIQVVAQEDALWSEEKPEQALQEHMMRLNKD